ncbi:MAG TPA: dehydrogenase, partial [Pseudolysinimonas sp.]|nr:dehydrogenase [Pseudolysinimonas sp.]
VTAMTATLPFFAKAGEADAAGQPIPAFFRHDMGFGTADDAAGLVSYLASDAAAGVTGQAIGIGGDRIQLWSHPEPVVTGYREGGWDYASLQEGFASLTEGYLQSFGEQFPPLPPELQPE